MAIEITDWLRRLGLEQYTATFHDNDIDAAVLPRLTAEDLRELGVMRAAHRQRSPAGVLGFAGICLQQ